MQLQIVTPVKNILKMTASAALCALTLSVPLSVPLPAQAQGLFTPAITVNDRAITYYELEQRALFMALLRAPGVAEDLARDALIQDRLKQQVLDEAGIEVGPEEVEAGIEEFATRTNLTPEQLIEALNQGGISRETLRDYVEIGILWREYIRTRYLAQARPSKDEIDRALGRSGSSGVQVLLSEVIIPVNAQTLVQNEELAAQIAATTSADAFASAARQYSASATAKDGGAMEWLPLSSLPAGLQPVFLALKTGENTAPIPLPNAVAIFRMRGIRETAVPTPRYSSIDYATYYIPGGRTPEALAVARSVQDRIDTCDDLYGIAKGQPVEVLERAVKKPGEIPRDIALELAKLDVNEVSTALTTKGGQNLVMLMLCARTNAAVEDASREEIAQALVQQRLEVLSSSLLDQLEADALITGR